MSIPPPPPMLDFVSAGLLSADFAASVFFAGLAIAWYADFDMILTLLRVVHSIGLLFSPGMEGLGPVGEFAILSRTSIPEIRWPKAVECPSRCGAFPCTTKNCEPAEFGVAVFAIERTTFTCSCALN